MNDRRSIINDDCDITQLRSHDTGLKGFKFKLLDNLTKKSIGAKIIRLIVDMNCGGTSCSGKFLKDMESRELICTPFDGAYGRAGWVMALNGSPPRGVIVALETERHMFEPPAIFFLQMDRSRRVGDAQAELVRDFIRELEKGVVPHTPTY